MTQYINNLGRELARNYHETSLKQIRDHAAHAHNQLVECAIRDKLNSHDTGWQTYVRHRDAFYTLRNAIDEIMAIAQNR